MTDKIKDILQKSSIPSKTDALPGRSTPLIISGKHAISNEPFIRPNKPNEAQVILGMGCFWGAERKLWNTLGVVVTSVGYTGGFTENPTYEEVCSGQTGHSEVVQVVYDTSITSLESILKVFWESHDPTQGMRQGNDLGSQYRSSIYLNDQNDLLLAETSKATFQKELLSAGHGMITTEIEPLDIYYFAEEYHQQYLHKKPNGYCGLSGTGVSCPIGLI